jgi:hypothetical protein
LPYDPYGLQNGEPWGLTFIARPKEDALLKWVLPLKKQQTKITNDYK